MTGFDLLANYHSDPESLIRKSRSRFSSPRSSGSRVQDIVDKIQGSPPPQEPSQMAGRKCINDFLAPSSNNVRTGSETNIRDGSFGLKPARINMVQQNPFCSKASEDANALTFLGDLQHIYHPRSNSGCGTPSPLSIFILRKGKTMVLFQQVGSVNLGEMLQCISHQVFFVGQDQCPSQQDLYLSTSQGCHISCDKFSSRTSNLNLWVWRWSCSHM
jgi:hypothetical protein